MLNLLISCSVLPRLWSVSLWLWYFGTWRRGNMLLSRQLYNIIINRIISQMLMKFRNKILQLLKQMTLCKWWPDKAYGGDDQNWEDEDRNNNRDHYVRLVRWKIFKFQYLLCSTRIVCAADKERDRKSFDDRVGGNWKSEPGMKKR